MKKITALILSMLLTLMLASCGEHQSHREESVPEEVPPSPEEQAASEAQARREAEDAALRTILSEMSIEEKIGQLFFVRCPESGALEDIAAYHLGGILLFSRDYKDGNENHLSKDDFTAKLQSYQYAAESDTGLPLFIGSDEEGGTVTRASRNPNLFEQKFPSPQQLYKAGGMTALLTDTLQYNDQLRTLGINVNFAPVADVSTNSKDFIYERSFGQNAKATADYVGQVVKTMGTANIGAVLKHFPGYGNNLDTHTGIAIDERPYEQFETEDFLPFSAGIKAGATFVLVSHNIVKCMDETLPASLSPAVHQILRKTLGFEGVVLTDDLAMGAVEVYAENGEAAVLALLAGNDMVLTSDYRTQYPQVLAAVQSGALSQELIDNACYRVLRAKYDLGLLSLSGAEDEK